jgi:hypothetical protein
LCVQRFAENIQKTHASRHGAARIFRSRLFANGHSEGASLPVFEITAWNLSGSIEPSKLLKTSAMRSAVAIARELIIADSAARGFHAFILSQCQDSFSLRTSRTDDE